MNTLRFRQLNAVTMGCRSNESDAMANDLQRLENIVLAIIIVCIIVAAFIIGGAAWGIWTLLHCHGA